ncbi:MAG TPA: type IV secretion system DNA-binding domain-containing protein [Burkholderiales bacterium]|nr:type IV secretion system DNA-binding domain-containing protein [Burkholderiales bacterium]
MTIVSPLAKAITANFYAWELRGRGWTLAPYPVVLEPPFRRCSFALPASPEPIDDGRRPTFLSSLAKSVRDAVRPGPPVPTRAPRAAFDEPAPYPELPRDETATLRVVAQSDFASDVEAARRFLRGLSPLRSPLSFEIVGHGGRVEFQVSCERGDAARIAGALSGYFPSLAVTEAEDLLDSRWATKRASFTVDFGLADEFFLPIHAFRSFSFDPYIPLMPALSRTGAAETLALQVLFTPVVNPWGRAITSALVRQGEPTFEDAPEFVPLAKEKTSSPMFAVVLRVAAAAASKEEARNLIRGTGDYFAQFSRPGSNHLIPLMNDGYPDDEHLEAFLLRSTYRSGMLLSAEELAGLVHPPDESVRHPALVRLTRRTKELPREARGHRLVLGVHEHQNRTQNASIEVAARLRHMHVIGASGTGKSTFLLNLISQDIAHGHGVAVLDPHGDLVEAVLARVPHERWRDVVLFDPADDAAPVGINLLQAQTSAEKTLLASDLVAIFQRYATSWGDAMSTVLGNAVLALLESPEPATLLDLRRFLVQEAFRRDFLSRIDDPEVQFFWKNEFPLIGTRALGPILTRLNTFLRPRLVRNVVAQREPRVRLEDVVRGRKIFLAKLAQGLIGRENCYLLGSLITSKFQQVAVTRQALDPARRTPYFIFLDEFQHFVAPSVESLLTEARKYSIGLVLAHQTLHQLRDLPTVEAAVLGNAHTRVVMRVGDDDARRLAEGFSFFESNDLQNLSQGEAVVRLGESANDFNLRVPAPAAIADANPATPAVIQALSREQFGTDAASLARELAESYGSAAAGMPGMEAMAADAECAAQNEGRPALPPVPPPAAETHPKATGADRTKAHPDVLTEGRGGREHKYLQHLVKRLAEERGFRATLEQPILGGAGNVDVSLVRDSMRVAVEISVASGHAWETKHVKQALGAGYAHVAIVTAAGRQTQSFERRIREQIDEAEQARVRFVPADAIVEFLDEFRLPQPEDTLVRGYRVKVKRQSIVQEDGARRRSDIASVIARSIEKNKPK